MPFVSLTVSSHYMQLWFTFCETYVYVSVNSFFSCGCSVYSFSFYGNLGTLPWCFEKTADCHICIETFNKGSVFFFFTGILKIQDDFFIYYVVILKFLLKVICAMLNIYIFMQNIFISPVFLRCSFFQYLVIFYLEYLIDFLLLRRCY